MKQTITFLLLHTLQFANAQDTLIQRLGKQFMSIPSAVGLSIGIYSDAKVQFYNFGTVARDKEQQPTKNTVYEIGSIAKTFTARLLAHAVIENKINLQDDIRKYLDGDYPNLEYEGHPVRIIHLANETAGIPDWLPPTPAVIKNASPDSVSFLREAIYAKFTRADFYKALREAVIDTLPGTKRRHSNAGADLLGYILEKVYGTPLEKTIQQYILIPLKMNHTGFAAGSKKVKSLAKGYDENGNKMPYVKNGISSTAADLLKYIKAHLDIENKASRLVLKKTVNVDLGSNVKVVEREQYVYSVALNWLSYIHENGFSQTWYDGGTHGFCSYIVFYPELNTGIVLLANSANQTVFSRLSGIAYEIAQKIKHERR